MDQVETRELTYFLAVAEVLHFGRAAERLGITQPPLSRAIRQLERRMGVRLFDRTSRRVTLTAAGEVFAREGRAALDALAAATQRAQRAQRAGRSVPQLVLAMKPGTDGGLLPDILRHHATGHDAVPVEVVICGPGQQVEMLRTGRADVALLRRPHNDLTGFDTEDLLVEPQVLAVPATHRLAARPSLRLADLRGETLPRWPGVPTDGPAAPDVHDVAQLMQLVALGEMVALVPASVRGHLRHDLTYVPVTDAVPTTVVAAWSTQNHSDAIARFVRSAATVAAHLGQVAATG